MEGSISNLANPLTSPKPYWSILKAFLNNKKFLDASPFSWEFNETSKRKLNFLTHFLQSSAY